MCCLESYCTVRQFQILPQILIDLYKQTSNDANPFIFFVDIGCHHVSVKFYDCLSD